MFLKTEIRYFWIVGLFFCSQWGYGQAAVVIDKVNAGINETNAGFNKAQLKVNTASKYVNEDIAGLADKTLTVTSGFSKTFNTFKKAWEGISPYITKTNEYISTGRLVSSLNRSYVEYSRLLLDPRMDNFDERVRYLGSYTQFGHEINNLIEGRTVYSHLAKMFADDLSKLQVIKEHNNNLRKEKRRIDSMINSLEKSLSKWVLRNVKKERKDIVKKFIIDSFLTGFFANNSIRLTPDGGINSGDSYLRSDLEKMKNSASSNVDGFFKVFGGTIGSNSGYATIFAVTVLVLSLLYGSGRLIFKTLIVEQKPLSSAMPALYQIGFVFFLMLVALLILE